VRALEDRGCEKRDLALALRWVLADVVTHVTDGLALEDEFAHEFLAFFDEEEREQLLDAARGSVSKEH